MQFEAVVIRSDCGRTLYAPGPNARAGGGVLVQSCVEGANAAAFPLATQVATAEYYGLKPLYIVRVRSKRAR